MTERKDKKKVKISLFSTLISFHGESTGGTRTLILMPPPCLDYVIYVSLWTFRPQ
jgi:hypothetical protein